MGIFLFNLEIGLKFKILIIKKIHFAEFPMHHHILMNLLYLTWLILGLITAKRIICLKQCEINVVYVHLFFFISYESQCSA